LRHPRVKGIAITDRASEKQCKREKAARRAKCIIYKLFRRCVRVISQQMFNLRNIT